MISEFGGLSFAPKPGEKWFGYGTAQDTDTLLAQYRDLVTALLDSTVLAGFCYTQLTDTEQETNGLFTADREPKFDPAVVRAINTQMAGSVPSEVLDAIQMNEVLERREVAQSAEAKVTEGP